MRTVHAPPYPHCSYFASIDMPRPNARVSRRTSSHFHPAPRSCTVPYPVRPIPAPLSRIAPRPSDLQDAAPSIDTPLSNARESRRASTDCQDAPRSIDTPRLTRILRRVSSDRRFARSHTLALRTSTPTPDFGTSVSLVVLNFTFLLFRIDFPFLG